uniref:Protein kinase domain-containing protein n=1 Tax=Trichobilharzia regenti TaxID=157069 RepID=A0AA85KAL9_TRIRE|nr:unnamed protein product [Trichobilharzia regenti]
MISLGAYEYNPADVLGNGAFAIVYKGRVRNNPDELVAIKIMLKDQNVLKSKTLLSKEICVLKDLNHENIVRLYDHSISSSGVYLVMEYCNGGDLSEYLQAKRTLPEDTIRHFLIQIGSAMDAMNRKGFMHRDLKPGNILLSHCRDCGQHVTAIPGYLLSFKLADFGFARFLQDGMMAVTMCGSPMYMAPEVLMCRKYDAVADIWSMGIIVYQCLTGKAPFYANTPEALKNIYEKTACLRPKIPVTTSKPLQDLLLKMLNRKPSERIDFQSFLNHRFLHQRHFEPRAGSGPESSTPRSSSSAASSIAPTLPSRNRPQVRGSGITVLGHGTGDGPYYLTPQDANRARDKTPQGKPSPNSSNDNREWNNPANWNPNTTTPVNQLNKPSQLRKTSSPPTPTDFDAYYSHQTGDHNLPPAPNYHPADDVVDVDDVDNDGNVGYGLDDIDDEMTKTTVDEYIEDDLDASSSSPPNDHNINNINNLPRIMPPPSSMKQPPDHHPPPVHSHHQHSSPNQHQQYVSNNYRPSGGGVIDPSHQLQHHQLQQQQHQRQTAYRGSCSRLDPRGGVCMNTAEMEYGEPPFEDYVIVNSDGSEVQRVVDRERFRQQSHLMNDHHPGSQISNISRIVRNPASYLTNPNVQRRGIPDMGPLPDVTAGTTVSDARYRQGTDDSHNNTCEIPSNMGNINNNNNNSSNKLADRYHHPAPMDSRCSPTNHKYTTRPISEPIRGSNDYAKEKFPGGQIIEGHFTGISQPPVLEPKISYMEPVISNVTLGAAAAPLRQLNYQANARQQQQLVHHPSGFQAMTTVQGGDVVYPVVTNPNFATGRNFENDFTSGGGGLWEAAEFSDEILMEPEHNEEIKKITMVLELCELLAELAERRASALADCTPTRVETTTTTTTTPTTTTEDGITAATTPTPTTTDTDPSNNKSPPMNSDNLQDKSSINSGRSDSINNPCLDGEQQHTGDNGHSEMNKTSTALKFVSEAQRIVEQIVLYRRVLYYLEYVFDQVKKAFQNGRLKSTATARRRLIDCNTLYHRCYIRLRQLARQSHREDLIEPVGRLLANITANRLIFQYALDQCYAAEMDEYIGEIALSLQRYKAGITLIHGLCQHAKSQRDKTLLADCMRLLRDRYACLWSTATKPLNPQTDRTTTALCSNNPTNLLIPDAGGCGGTVNFGISVGGGAAAAATLTNGTTMPTLPLR